MDKVDESRRYKWSTSATNLLLSVWSHDMVQNQLNISARNQPIWESIARYMGRKGFNVTGLQCRTRIKNMLCSYYEAVRKNDQTCIEPYFDLFKKVVHSRNSKRKGCSKIHSKIIKQSRLYGAEMDEDRDPTVPDLSTVSDEQLEGQNTSDSTYHVEYLDANNQDAQSTATSLTDNELLLQFQNIIAKAIETQTKVMSEAFRLQTEIIEKLIVSEREKLETLLLAEKESRKQLESRLDKLLARLEGTGVPHLTYMGTLIQSRQNEVL